MLLHSLLVSFSNRYEKYLVSFLSQQLISVRGEEVHFSHFLWILAFSQAQPQGPTLFFLFTDDLRSIFCSSIYSIAGDVIVHPSFSNRTPHGMNQYRFFTSVYLNSDPERTFTGGFEESFLVQCLRSFCFP